MIQSILLILTLLVGPAMASDMSDGKKSLTSDLGVGAYLQGAISDLGGDTQTASRAYLAALAEDPDSLMLRNRVLELAMVEGDVDTAIRLAKSLKPVDQSTMSRLVEAVAYAHDHDIKRARTKMRLVNKTAPELLQFELMMVYLDYADGVKVEKLVKRLEKLPLAPLLEGRRKFHEGRLWLKKGEVNKAMVVLEAAHKAEPNAVFTALLLAQVYARQGMVDKASALMADFSARNPAVSLILPPADDFVKNPVPPFAATLDQDLAASIFDFGLLVWAQGAWAPARQLMNLTLWLEPDQPYYRYYTAILLEMGGDLLAASQEYEKLKKYPSMTLAAELRLAETQFKMGEKDRGLRMVEELSEDHPEITLFRKSLAQMAFDRADYNRAVKEYTVMYDELPANTPAEAKAELLFARGAAYERGGKLLKAADDLQQALMLQPVNAQIMNYLGYMWVEQGVNIEEAFALLKKAHLLAPQDGAITDSIGWAYFKRGDVVAAQKYLELAAEQEPESAEIIDHLADIYAKLDKQDEARKYWQRALQLLDKGAEVPQPDFRRQVEKKLR